MGRARRETWPAYPHCHPRFRRSPVTPDVSELCLKARLTVPLVALQPKSDIARRPVLELRNERPHSPTDRIDVRVIVAEPELQMALTHEPRRRSKSRSRNREYRGRIADAVRLEVAKQGLEIAVERAQRDDDVHLYLGHQIVDREPFVGNRVEALLEFLQS